MREEDFLKKHLPVPHNSQDVIYVKARYRWIYSLKGADNRKLFTEAMDTYTGTTFQQKYYPKDLENHDRSRQAQQPLF